MLNKYWILSADAIVTNDRMTVNKANQMLELYLTYSILWFKELHLNQYAYQINMKQ